MAKRKIAYSYVRFSRPEQLKGDSLRRQKKNSKKWCEKNGYFLDDSLKLTDKGISAFRGDNASRGKLRAFMDAVDEGRVKKGSVLIVESLDRISRQAVGTALAQFMDILSKGIRIVTLEPEETFDSASINDTVKLIVVIVIISRAYEESATKAKRLTYAWEEKRRKLSEGVKLTGRVPGWIEKTGNKFILNDHAKTIKRIVKLYLAGHGPTAIAKTLNEDKVPTIGRGKQRAKLWQQSTILKIIKNPALIGEFQPHFGNSRQDQSKRVPAGDPILNYYPAIIKEAEYYKIKKRLDDNRTSLVGRVSSSDGRLTNLFKGMIYNSRDKSSMVIVNKGAKSSGRQLVSSKARTDKNSEYIAFPYEVLEESIFRMISQITSADLLPQEKTDFSEKLEAAQLKEAKLQAKVIKIQNQIEIEEDIEPFLPLLTKFNTQLKEAKIETEELETKIHDSLPTSDECKSIIELMKSEENENDNRRRFRNVFLNIVERVDILPLKSGHWRQAIIKVTFQNGTQRTIVAVCHRAKLVLCGAMNERNKHKKQKEMIISLPVVNNQVEAKFKAAKARSVEQTKQNLKKMFNNYYAGYKALEDPVCYVLKEQPVAKDSRLYIEGEEPPKKKTRKKPAAKRVKRKSLKIKVIKSK